MESMDNFRERFEALEQRTEQLQQHTRTVERRLRWWRGIACGAIVLALLGFPLQSGKAQYEDKDLAQRVADLEYKLEYVSGGPNEVVITGANLRIVNGLGRTDCGEQTGEPIPNCPNGLGNLIVGYNEERSGGDDRRTGSHNVVLGTFNNFSRFGGVVAGLANEISGDFASVYGGVVNRASGEQSVVSGGDNNTASGRRSWVGGGILNRASGSGSSVTGGRSGVASGIFAAVSGGISNTASRDFSSVSGGSGNTASGIASSVSGGGLDPFVGQGGAGNTASGDFSSVSGGTGRSAPGTHDWAAGPLFADN
jgi:hypothetical protein